MGRKGHPVSRGTGLGTTRSVLTQNQFDEVAEVAVHPANPTLNLGLEHSGVGFGSRIRILSSFRTSAAVTVMLPKAADGR